MLMNPGFTGRFASALHFQDWDANELSNLVISQLEKGPPPDLPYILDNAAVIKAFLDDFFPKLRAHNFEIFSNARDAVEMCKLVKIQYSIRCGSVTPFPPVTGIAPYCAMQFLFLPASHGEFNSCAVADVEAAAKAFLNVRVASRGKGGESKAAGGGGTAAGLRQRRQPH